MKDLGRVIRERRIEAAGQFFVAERLLQKANSPSVKHAVANPLIWKGGDDDHRSSPALRDQALQQLDAAQALHLNVENQATGLARI